MDQEDYIVRVLQDHLLEKDTYRMLLPGEIEAREQIVRDKLENIMWRAKRDEAFEEHEFVYLKRAAAQCTCIPQFYITMKLHKEI